MNNNDRRLKNLIDLMSHTDDDHLRIILYDKIQKILKGENKDEKEENRLDL